MYVEISASETDKQLLLKIQSRKSHYRGGNELKTYDSFCRCEESTKRDEASMRTDLTQKGYKKTTTTCSLSAKEKKEKKKMKIHRVRATKET
jgi:hypothetical protein